MRKMHWIYDAGEDFFYLKCSKIRDAGGIMV